MQLIVRVMLMTLLVDVIWVIRNVNVVAANEHGSAGGARKISRFDPHCAVYWRWETRLYGDAFLFERGRVQRQPGKLRVLDPVGQCNLAVGGVGLR